MFGTNEIVGRKYFRDAPADTLFVTSIFYTLQGEGPYAGMPAVFVRLAKCQLKCHFCFTPTTTVLMCDGKHKHITDVKVGDMVMSWSGDKFEPKPVTKVMTSVATELVKVIMDGDPVCCTSDHPFLTSNRKWVKAGELQPGDKIVHWTTHADSGVSVGKIVKHVEYMAASDASDYWEHTNEDESAERIVYNLEVADNHTYVANNCVVHNCDTFFDDGEWLTYTELEARIYHTICDFWNNRGDPAPVWAVNGFNSYPGIVLVMTGGEPLLQDNISQFMANQVGRYAAVQVESNGILDTHVPEGVTLVCSPKCAEKGNVAIKYFAPSKTILKRADCLKFVMSADTASPYSSIPDWAFEWKQKNPTKDIFVSPMNIYNTLPQTIKVLRADDQRTITMQERSTVDEKISFWEPGVLNLAENQRNHEYTGLYCAQHGLRLNLQQHIYCSLA